MNRQSRPRARLPVFLAVVLACFGARLAWAQQHAGATGGTHQMADLFKVFFTWDATSITTTGSRGVISSAGAGSNGFANTTNGARVDFGAGASDYASSDGTTVTFAGPIAANAANAGDQAITLPVNRKLSFTTDGTDNMRSNGAGIGVYSAGSLITSWSNGTGLETHAIGGITISDATAGLTSPWVLTSGAASGLSGTAPVLLTSRSAGVAGIYMAAAATTPTTSNYTVLGDSSGSYWNAPVGTTDFFCVGNACGASYNGTTVANTGTGAGFTSAAASGTNAYGVTTNGARYDFGAGASDYASSDGTTVTFAGPLTTASNFTWGSGTSASGFLGGTTNYATVSAGGAFGVWIYGANAAASGRPQIVLGSNTNLNDADLLVGFADNSSVTTFQASVNAAGYIASTTPVTLSSVNINNTILPYVYGGATLPAHPFTVTDIGYFIRAVGSGGSTNNTFQISDGTNTCNCTFACNQAVGPHIATCANSAGTGCVYAASATLFYLFSAIGDCTTASDVLGNLDVRGKWQ